MLKLFLIATILTAAATIASAQINDRPASSSRSLGGATSGSIEGRVVLPAGHSTNPNIRVRLRVLSNPLMTLYADKNGSFRFTELGEGIYYVDVEGDTKLYEPVTQRVELGRGGQVKFTIYLEEKNVTFSEKPSKSIVSVADLDQKVPAPARKEYERATRLIEKGDARQAIEHLKQAISIYTDYQMARNELGVQYLKLKRLGEAAEQFNAVIEKNPKAFNARLNLGLTLVEAEKYTEAIDQLRQATSIDDTQPAAHLFLGIALLKTDKLPEAYRELSAALLMNNAKYSVAHYYMAFIYIKRGEKEQARSELRAYLETSPTGEQAAQAQQMLERLK